MCECVCVVCIECVCGWVVSVRVCMCVMGNELNGVKELDSSCVSMVDMSH